MSETERYYATYCRLEARSSDTLVVLDGNAVIIGAELTVTPQTYVTNRGKEVPRIVLGGGGQALGFLPDDVYKRVSKLLDDGWTCRSYAADVVFDKRVESYWVDVAVICYRPEDAAAFDVYAQLLSGRIAKGEHPTVTLSPKEYDLVKETGGNWTGAKEQKLPKLEKGAAYYKTRRTMVENLAYAAAEGNKGCYVGMFGAVFLVVFLVIWFIFLR